MPSPTSCQARGDCPRVDRRRFHLVGLAALASGLGACGGGGSDASSGPGPVGMGGGQVVPPEAEVGNPRGPAVVDSDVTSSAVPPVGAGMQGLTPWTVAGPVPGGLALKALQRLDDGRVALAWLESPASGEVGTRRLHLRVQSCQGACGGVDRVLVDGLPDAEPAASILPDGAVLVAWRQVLERVPGNELAVERSLWMQRFTPAGVAAGPAERVDAFVFSSRLEGGGRGMGPPAIGHWEDGSFVVTWADVRTFGSFPGLATSVRTRRYHTNGWPVAPARTVATSHREQTYRLDLPPASGGYVISHVQSPLEPSYQNILPLEFWNPLPEASLARLLPGSFLLSLGVCGTLLFAGRTDPGTGRPVWTRERFEYSGHAAGAPAMLPGLPLGGVALKNVEFLVLFASAKAGLKQAQRMDKYGRIFGMPFEMPEGATALLDDGSLLVAWVAAGADGRRLMLQRFVPTPVPPDLTVL